MQHDLPRYLVDANILITAQRDRNRESVWMVNEAGRLHRLATIAEVRAELRFQCGDPSMLEVVPTAKVLPELDQWCAELALSGSPIGRIDALLLATGASLGIPVITLDRGMLRTNHAFLDGRTMAVRSPADIRRGLARRQKQVKFLEERAATGAAMTRSASPNLGSEEAEKR